MSKDIDQSTMDALAGQGDGHALRVDLDGDVLLTGTVNIERNAEGLSRAEAMQTTITEIIARLKAAVPLLLAFCLICSITAPSFAAGRKVYEPRSFVDRTWTGLSKARLRAINEVLRDLPASKVQIFCGGNFCRRLAEDLDEAFESAGFDSTIELPMFDLGKGMAISPANDASRKIAASIRDITSGQVDLKVIDQSRPVAGRLIIALGRIPPRNVHTVNP
jgi:hypothetical protein